MKYSETHEWVTVDEEGVGTVGVSHQALKELGEVVYVELPEIGKQLKQSEEACVLESTKAAADIYSPVSGEIIAVNDLHDKSIDKLNASPEQEGWLFKVRLDNPEELEKLLTEQSYLDSLGSKYTARE